MSKYRMKELQNLREAEMEVKQGVYKQLSEQTELKSKRLLPRMITIFASLIAVMLVFLLLKPSEELQVVQTGSDFSLGKLSLGTFDIRESYFIATPIKWNGNEVATLHTVELVDREGNLIDYENDHLAFRTFITNEIISPGVYKKNEIDDMEEWSNLRFEQHSEQIVLFNLLVNQNYQLKDELQVKLTFDIAGQNHVEVHQWDALNNIKVATYNFTQLVEQLQLTEQELSAYETLKQSENRSVLKELSPMNIARLYWLAGIEGNFKLQYMFYTTQPEWIMWSFEEQQTFPPFDMNSFNEAVQLFKDISLGEFIATSDKEGYISFVNQGNEAAFQLLQNEEGIWEVAFMPMQ